MQTNNLPVIILKMTNAYDHSSFCQSPPWFEPPSVIDLRDLSGTNCYCDDEAARQIEDRLAPLSLRAIHLLDSGNYHYLSYFWLKRISVPFRLLLFDNHTDMQPPALGEILSCGGWVRDSSRDIPNLEEIWLVGPDQDSFDQVDPLLRDKTRFLSREALSSDPEAVERYLRSFCQGTLPVYISIDKDVLCEKDVATNWNQGDLTLNELKDMLRKIWDWCIKTSDSMSTNTSTSTSNSTISSTNTSNSTSTCNSATTSHLESHFLGMDLCGESDKDDEESTCLNETANLELAQCLL